MENTYKPDIVKRVMIPKENGKQRPLGIPTIRDRVVQTACKFVIEPIFEADFDDNSFGFRPKRSAKDAVKRIKENLKAGNDTVLDADLSKYFDTIPHKKLLILVGGRVSDKGILHLLKLWLKSPVSEDGKIIGGKKNKVGTPQGGVISPLLANIYLNLMDKIVRKNPIFKDIQIVRYADDFVLMGKMISKAALSKLSWLFGKMELTLNETKTHMVDAKSESFEFLGFVFRYDRSLFGGNSKYWNVTPSEKSLKKLRSKIKESLRRNRQRNAKIAVGHLNPILRGWLNYFTIEGVSYTKLPRRKIKIYLRGRLFRHQRRKSQRYKYAYCRKTLTRWMTSFKLIDPETYGIPAPVKA